MTWKSYVAASGAGLVATYLMSTPPAVTPNRSTPRAAAVEAPPGAAAVDIEEQATRLQARLGEATEYREPSRNPFRFGARPAPRPAVATAAPAPEPQVLPAAPSPPPFPYRLSGIATTMSDGARQRTAILIGPGGLAEAREGDMIAVDYRVARIDEDGVEIVAADGRTLRLTVRP